jgi:superfamily I DNA/RNA helicase
MSLSPFLRGLNKSQQKAVLHNHGPLLVLAGAGSGKTRVLTNRIARLVHEKVCKPSQVLAVTFTNKAALEMRERLAKMVSGQAARALTVSTFHSLGARILRESGQAIGIQKSFTILDDHQRLAAVKEVVRSAGGAKLAEKHEEIGWAISLAKNTSADPEQVEKDSPQATPRFKRIYEAYASFAIRRQTIDFDDLLLLPLKLFERHPNILQTYRDRFGFISIDEFQDTNLVQLRLARLLAAPGNNIMAVGDDDQGIYSWRGADINNILSFPAHFPNCTTVVLDTNYRSTSTILDAAMAVVGKNRKRTVKNIAAAAGAGEKITVYKADDETDEADWIAQAIKDNAAQNRFGFADHALLLRANAMMRRFEEGLRRHKVPYHVFGALSFFDSKEIKDILAYLRFFANPRDEISLARVLKVPNRGISATSMEKLEELAGLRRIGLFEAMQRHGDADLAVAQHANCSAFLEFVQRHAPGFARGELSATMRAILAECDYMKLLASSSKTEVGAGMRTENVEEILSGLSRYESRTGGAAPQLSGYLQELALVKSDESDEDAGKERGVRLMTLHKAKGLEFTAVFLCNLDDAVMPSPKTVAEGRIEEERRLFYVGMTRAKKMLYLTYPHTKEFRKKLITVTPCRFIREIPEEFVDAEFAEQHEAKKQEYIDNFFDDMRKKFAAQSATDS